MKNLLVLIIIISALATVNTGCNNGADTEDNNNDTTAVNNTVEELNYEEAGLKIANAAKAELGKNLLGAINDYGAPGAVTFCNTRAIPLTDSMANLFHAYVKRVSDKPRNPDNNANDAELAYITLAKEQLARGEQPKSQLTEAGGKMIGYYAILTNSMCLQCHGQKGKDILPETYTNIIKAYPDDKATGYGDNELRGIWVVSMDKK